MIKQAAIVLLSGGMDSCVCAAIANKDYRLAFLHVNYGQRTEARELRSFNEIADFYNAEMRLSVSLEHLKIIGGSALTDASIPVPEAAAAQSALNNQQFRSPMSPSETHTCFPSPRHGRK